MREGFLHFRSSKWLVLREVSVIISTYSIDRTNYIMSCIESLKRQTLLPKEIILVLDPNEILIDFYKSRVPNDVKIVISEEYGLSKARNAGVRNAEGEVVAFIDDDAVAGKDWLENMVKNYDDPRVVGVGGLIKPMWGSGRPKWFPEELDWVVGCSYKGLPECKTDVRNPIGCNMSFRKSVFEKVGYFKANIGRFGKKLLAGEEAELSIRIREKIPKSKIVYDPSVVVYHMVHNSRTNLRYLLRRSFYEGVSKAFVTSSKSNPLEALSTEDRYLRYLLKVAIPLRLKRIYKLENICHLLLIFVSVCMVLVGFSLRMLTKPRQNHRL